MSRRPLLLRAAPLCLGLLLAACGGGADAPDAPSITATELASRLEAGTAPLVLDVRTEAEYQAGHIPGATLIPINQLPARVGELAGHENEEVVVHCKGGKRAAAAERVLREAGFTRVVDLEGHMDGWQAAGLPVE
jgi:rhodanese-related sulfurtransferase